jgi:hypothetical protein
MKNCCFPLASRLNAWEYFFLFGLFAGPDLIYYTIFQSGWQDWGKAGGFFGGIFLMALGFLVLRTIIMGYLPLEWDHEEVRWGLSRRKWSDLKAITVQNKVTVSSISEAAKNFDRSLVFWSAEGKERLRVPFYRKDYADREIINQADPVWNEFLREVERRFSFPPGSIAAEQDLSEQKRKETKEGTTPAPVTWIFGAVGIILLLFPRGPARVIHRFLIDQP